MTDDPMRTFPSRSLDMMPDLLLALVHHVLENPQGRAILATSPDLPVDVLIALARDPKDEVRRAVAGNPATPPAALAALAGQWSCRWAVASNAATPATLLVRLASDWDPAVRAAVAGNPSTSAEVLAGLEVDHHRAVRDGVARTARRSCQGRALPAGHGTATVAGREALAPERSAEATGRGSGPRPIAGEAMGW
jgi:hypothetical protein